MIATLWLMSQLLVVTALVMGGASLAESPVQAVLFGATAALLLATAITAVVFALRAAATIPVPSARPWLRAGLPRAFRLAQDPGVPGAVLVRAPARLVSPLG